MKTKEKILEIGADGGSISLLIDSDNYYIEVSEYFFKQDATNPKQSFSMKDGWDFAEIINHLQTEYPMLFQLYPAYINDDYKNAIKEYYLLYCKGEKKKQTPEWQNILNISKNNKPNFKIPKMKNKVVQHGGQTVNIAEVKNIKLSQFTDSEKNNTIIIEFKTRLEYIYNPNIEEYELQKFNDVAEEYFPDWSTASAYFQEWIDVWQGYLDNLN